MAQQYSAFPGSFQIPSRFWKLPGKAEDCKVIVPHLSDPSLPNIPQQVCGDMTIPTKAILNITELQKNPFMNLR